MTTRNLVPRGDSQGKLGISNKRWEEVNTVTLKVENLQNASGSILLKSGPGIANITLDSDQLKVGLDSSLLVDLLGFDSDGTFDGFTSTSKIISPPFPPLPPSGPPNSIYFSLLKLKQPSPPSPLFTKILASSINFILRKYF